MSNKRCNFCGEVYPKHAPDCLRFAPAPVSSPTPPERSELTVQQAIDLGYIKGLLLEENEMIATSDINAVRQELETAKLLYNDLARENEALREAGHMTPEVLKKYCDNARAYGWEAGRIYGSLSLQDAIPALQATYSSHPLNPFVDPDWDKDLKLPQGWNLTAKDNPL